jgi:hypothetical protein
MASLEVKFSITATVRRTRRMHLRTTPRIYMIEDMRTTSSGVDAQSRRTRMRGATGLVVKGGGTRAAYQAAAVQALPVSPAIHLGAGRIVAIGVR